MATVVADNVDISGGGVLVPAQTRPVQLLSIVFSNRSAAPATFALGIDVDLKTSQYIAADRVGEKLEFKDLVLPVGSSFTVLGAANSHISAEVEVL